MRNRKKRIETFSFFDHAGISRHLEEMASKGWMIKKVCAWRTLAPERGCASSHFPLRGVRLLAEHSHLTGNEVSC